MLQRIQSLLLLITAICLGIFLGTNLFVKAISPDEKVVVNAYHFFHQKGGIAVIDKPVYYIALVAALSLALTVFIIFQYKNRIRQMLFVALNSLMLGVVLALSVYHIQKDAMPMGNSAVQGSYGIGMYAIFIALLCNWFANRFIKKDEKLVKDADRMR